MKCSVIRVAAGSPSDVSMLEKDIEEGKIRPREVIAVIGKTEGNGCVNDFTRGYAVQTLTGLFREYAGEEGEQIHYVMSGGTEGILSPHFTVVSKTAGTSGRSGSNEIKSLAIGVARTRNLLAEEIGRRTQIEEVAAAVGRAVRDAGIERHDDVHFVQIKCPLLTAERIRAARERGARVVTEETYKSMGYSRGASALGVALALGEVDRDTLAESDVCSDWSKYSSVASASAGVELLCCEIIVFGNALGADGPYYIDHAVMKDAIDGGALGKLLERRPTGAELVQVLAKAEADPTGFIRGSRHTMLNDSDINHTRQARAVVGGVLASVCGDPMIYVSGGGEHQGPAGGGPVAAIFRRRE
ncbi:ring-opening amidohydrolase [Paenibacillus glucanolyticus]|nr:cyanuric acid amidohydrolase [Paenibacillus sp. PDC88]